MEWAAHFRHRTQPKQILFQQISLHYSHFSADTFASICICVYANITVIDKMLLTSPYLYVLAFFHLIVRAVVRLYECSPEAVRHWREWAQSTRIELIHFVVFVYTYYFGVSECAGVCCEMGKQREG